MIGGNVLFAALNQMNEKAQKIIDNTNAPYILTLLFNALSFVLVLIYGVANLILFFQIFVQLRKKLNWFKSSVPDYFNHLILL